MTDPFPPPVMDQTLALARQFLLPVETPPEDVLAHLRFF
jgi:hypothetical protein